MLCHLSGLTGYFANGLGTIRSYQNDNKLVAYFGRVNINIDDNVSTVSEALSKDISDLVAQIREEE